MKEVEIASQHLQGGWRRLYMSGGVLAVDEQVEVVGEGDHDEHLHLQLEDLGCGTACFGWFWNGDMEMTCGLRIVEHLRLRLAGLLLLFLLHLPLLVEDLLGLAVADEQDDGGEDQDDRAPGAAVAKAKGVGARSSWSGKVV